MVLVGDDALRVALGYIRDGVAEFIEHIEAALIGAHRNYAGTVHTLQVALFRRFPVRDRYCAVTKGICVKCLKMAMFCKVPLLDVIAVLVAIPVGLATLMIAAFFIILAIGDLTGWYRAENYITTAPPGFRR